MEEEDGEEYGNNETSVSKVVASHIFFGEVVMDKETQKNIYVYNIYMLLFYTYIVTVETNMCELCVCLRISRIN